MTCKAEGYKTITQYIKVGDEMANINIEMEAGSDDTDASSVSSNTVTASSSGYQVYIDAPQGGELYVDGKYIGLIPTSFDKRAVLIRYPSGKRLYHQKLFPAGG